MGSQTQGHFCIISHCYSKVCDYCSYSLIVIIIFITLCNANNINKKRYRLKTEKRETVFEYHKHYLNIRLQPQASQQLPMELSTLPWSVTLCTMTRRKFRQLATSAVPVCFELDLEHSLLSSTPK